MHENELTEKVIGAALEVHKRLGPGLLESIYEECLCIELDFRGVLYERQKVLPIRYRGRSISPGYRMDLLVAKTVVVELKSAKCLIPVDEAQLLTPLRLTGCTVGLLINFNVAVLKHGIRRMVNHFPDSAPPRLCGEA